MEESRKKIAINNQPTDNLYYFFPTSIENNVHEYSSDADATTTTITAAAVVTGETAINNIPYSPVSPINYNNNNNILETSVPEKVMETNIPEISIFEEPPPPSPPVLPSQPPASSLPILTFVEWYQQNFKKKGLY